MRLVIQRVSQASVTVASETVSSIDKGLLILVGVVLGGLIGKLCAGVPALSWLNYGQSFGFVNPMVLDLGILVLTFGFTVDITVAGILGIVIAIIIYRLL